MDANTPLPKLNPQLRLTPAPVRPDGTPSWTLYHPVSDKYYRIDWAEFECLARFPDHKNIGSLVQSVNSETTLTIDSSDVHSLIQFLNYNGLLSLRDQSIGPQTADKASLWKRILHGYLFFSRPLCQPDSFLRQTLPLVQPFLNRTFVYSMLALLILGVFMTLPRLDEFMNSIPQIMTTGGVISGLLIFIILKIIHEMAHAYTATYYGVRVPHMGIAFIILYPILYTETSGAWQLSSRRNLFHIGIAGIIAELSIAAIALMAWHTAPSDSLIQSLAFTTVTVSLISSLLVNLNPLMRFDGYYLLCDLTGEDNLQHRACTSVRHFLRNFLFSDDIIASDNISPKRQKFLTFFGFALLIYRFFLFLGIALLIYFITPKPFGAILAAIEIYWFILLPIYSELKIWWEKSSLYKQSDRTKITLSILVIIILLIVIPFPRTIYAPAVLHAVSYQDIYPPADAFIDLIQVTDKQSVRAGDVLINLSSAPLQRDIAYQTEKLKSLRQSQASLGALLEGDKSLMNAIDADIILTQTVLDNLNEQAQRLIITAPFDGIVRDITPDIQAKRFVSENQFLFRIIQQDNHAITAYVKEHDLPRITMDTRVAFMPDFSALQSHHATITSIDNTNTKELPWKSLSSLYGGEIPTTPPNHSENPMIIQSRYAIHATLDTPLASDFVQTGHLRLRGEPSSLIIDIFSRITALFIREFGIN